MKLVKVVADKEPVQEIEDTNNDHMFDREPVQEIEDTNNDHLFERIKRKKPITFERTLSTGSTLLDLVISGTRVRGGGLPGGIMAEFYGPPSAGKTAILAAIVGSTLRTMPKGDGRYQDPEGRLNLEYSRLYGMDLPKDRYDRPDTVKEMFQNTAQFFTKHKGNGIAVAACDSIAALSTDAEMEDEDKRGQQRAKDFSAGLRKNARILANTNHLMVWSNQIRDGDFGYITPGGHANRFYTSLRVEVSRYTGGSKNWRIERTRKIKGKDGKSKEITQQVGIVSECYVAKSSIDIPFRTAPLYIEFDYGIDDIRGNLQWLKDMTRDTVYGLDKGTQAQSIDLAIWKIEGEPDEDGKPAREPRVGELRTAVIDLWEEIQHQFKTTRAPRYT